jgi:hydroxymethylglutaryl-CoA reductase
MSSRIPGFYRLPPEARLSAIEDRVRELQPCDLEAWSGAGLELSVADMMVENVIGTFGLPNAVAVNFLVNGREVLVPMVVEEPSVVAAASNMARLTRTAGGIWAEADDALMIGQIQVVPREPTAARADAVAAALEDALPALSAMVHGVHPRLEERGGGLRGMGVRRVRYDEPGEAPEEMVVLHFYLDCVDAMGANMVNTVAELLGPEVERIAGEPVGLQILSNLSDRRLARARVTLRPEHLDHGDASGEEVARAIASAYRFAYADPYRAATHNKGVLNGIDAVCLATGNDWRAIEAGAHAYAARSGQYRSLTAWRLLPDGSLRGTIELPMAIGTVGGPIRVHPTVQANLKLLGNPRARELAAIIAAVGLAQNLGAIRALATEGIQKGHMRMHARNVAATAGAAPEQVPEVARRLAEAHDYSMDFARKVIAELEG